MTSAIWNGVKIAESNETIKLEGKPLLPLDSVKKDYLRPSSHDEPAPMEGRGDLLFLGGERKDEQRCGLVLRRPRAAAANINGYLAFWNGVEVV